MIDELDALLDALNLYIPANSANATPVLLQHHPSVRAEMLEHLRDHIHKMDGQMARMSITAQKFKQFEKNMVRCHSAFQNAQSPIFSLPPEILRNIFARVVCASDDRVLPEELLLVCSAWKSLILSSPELWTGIEVDLKNPNRSRAYVELSKPWKVQITLLKPNFFDLSGNTLGTIPSWIASEDVASRLTCLCVQLETHFTQSVWAWLIMRDSPLFVNLSILEIVYFAHGGSEMPLDLFLTDTKFPRLTSLRLSGVILTPTSPEKVMNIQSLFLENFFVDDAALVALMRSCPQLHTLHMRDGFPEHTFMGVSLVHLPNLREFEVSSYDTLIIIDLLRRIEAPGIRTLKIASFDTYTLLDEIRAVPHTALDAFLSAIANQSLNELEICSQTHTMTLFLSMLLREAQLRGSSAFLGLRRLMLRIPLPDSYDSGDGNGASQLRALMERLHERGARLQILEVTSNFIANGSETLGKYVGAVHIIPD
ncbi:uncharacterized protein EI90DRAFT_3018792 [Cantharellus anzutake]|uniref:uncharacterized protein n=1 Tax=Cantharellus anzutake TaxID=1750568 RepID=UPI0019068C9A|nr:uncharacterized protein EI90DRAFT_3018792 [Cantharellus anzutake]KAF8326063.1 hypothetical protein EI90DRAFT_3018792 [Cantharellus anzutake]